MFQSEAVKRYFQTANERHSIYLKRQRGEPWPWTDDPIFNQYKFTNVHRSLDVGTQWLRENWLEPFADHPMLFFNVCLYRQFNWIGTAAHLGFTEGWKPEPVYEYLHNYKNTPGNKLYTSAHMIAGPKFDKVGYREKLRWTIYGILDPLYCAGEQFIPQSGDNLQSAFNRLLPAMGFGSFITYEVISDLRHTRYLNQADDIMTWANAGPGAIRGLHRLLGNSYKTSMKQSSANELMYELLGLSRQFLVDWMPAWEMREVEHWLCEFDKYERVRLGQGRPRCKFIPPHKR